MSNVFARRSVAICAVATTILGIGAAGASGAAPVAGGDVVFGQESPPDCLGPMLGQCSSIYAGRIAWSGTVLENLLTNDASGRYIPDLATRVPTGRDISLRNGVLSVTFTIQPAAAWSDGTPFTTDDVIFTWKTIMNDRNGVASRIGWKDVASITGRGPKSFTVNFKKGRTFAGWKDMFSLGGGFQMLPKHILQGKDYNTVWNNGGFDTKTPYIGTGPFLLQKYTPQQATLAPNPRYWARARTHGAPYLGGITVTSGIGAAGVVTELRSGEINAAAPLPDFQFLSQIPGIKGISVQHRPAISIEHIALNTEAAPLTDVDVRRALAYATDRAGIVHGLLKGQVPVLNSGPTLVPAVPGYVPAFARYTYDPARAAAILTGDGWARGGDGIFAKDGKRLSITVSYVPTNAQRRINLTFLAQRARAAGIELVPTPDPNLYSSSLPKGAFQAAEFGFSGSVDPSQSSLLGADQVPTAANDYAGQNIYRYTGVGALAERSDYIVSNPRGVPASAPFGGPARRAALRDMQIKLAADVPFIPLYVTPNTFAGKSTLVGPRTNVTSIDPFWNTATWYFKGGKD